MVGALAVHVLNGVGAPLVVFEAVVGRRGHGRVFFT